MNKRFSPRFSLLLISILPLLTNILGCGGGRLSIEHFKGELETTNFTPLMRASRDGEFKEVNALIQEGVNLDLKEEKGLQTSLHYAAKGCHTQVAELLIKHGVAVAPINDYLYTPLHYAAEGGHAQIVELLIKHGATVDPTNNDLYTPLHYAAMGGYAPIVELLFKRGANINTSDAFSKNPLYHAMAGGYMKTANLLLEFGSEVKPHTDSGGETLVTATSYLLSGEYLQESEKMVPALENFGAAHKYFEMASSQFRKKSQHFAFEEGLSEVKAVLSVVVLPVLVTDESIRTLGQSFQEISEHHQRNATTHEASKELFSELSTNSKKYADEVQKVLECYRSHRINTIEIVKCVKKLDQDS